MVNTGPRRTSFEVVTSYFVLSQWLGGTGTQDTTIQPIPAGMRTRYIQNIGKTVVITSSELNTGTFRVQKQVSPCLLLCMGEGGASVSYRGEQHPPSYIFLRIAFGVLVRR
jgi:hypothetical protein